MKSETPNDYYFSQANQKIYKFEIAKELFTSTEADPDECITLADQFVQRAFERIFKKQF